MATNIKIGIVSIPTMMVNTLNKASVSIQKHKVHLKDNGKVGHRNYCKTCFEEITNDEIGTEYKGKVLTDDEVENIKSFMENNTIEIVAFRDLDVSKKKDFFLNTYYLLPDMSKTAKKVNQKNFCAFREAIGELGKVGVGIHTSRGTQRVALMYVEGDRMKMSLIPFSDAINKDIINLEERSPVFESNELPIEQAKQFVEQNIDEGYDTTELTNTVKEKFDRAVIDKEGVEEFGEIEATEEVCVFSEALKKEC